MEVGPPVCYLWAGTVRPVRYVCFAFTKGFRAPDIFLEILSVSGPPRRRWMPLPSERPPSNKNVPSVVVANHTLVGVVVVPIGMLKTDERRIPEAGFSKEVLRSSINCRGD